MTRPTLLRPRATLTALLAVVALGVSACGSDDDTSVADDPTTSEASPTPSESTEPTETDDGEEATDPTEPVCSDVWVAGQVLPRSYRGCYDSEKARWVEAMVYRCSAGEKVVTWKRSFYAVTGEKVIETSRPLARDPEFQNIMKTCGA